MSLYFKKETGTVLHPVFLKILERSQGGALIKVDSRVPTDLHTIFEGTPIATNTTAGEYMWMKSAVVATACADGATRIVIYPPNPFKIGEFVGAVDMAAATFGTITAVAPTYVVTAQTDFSLAKGEVLYQANAANATAPKFRPYALLENPIIVREEDGTTKYNVFAPLVHRGSIAASVFRWGYTTDVKNRLNLIKFRNQGQV
uniref:Uncharacterized protein n=1 Tax=viral metagenome TaxID=1070528 RepID=A0A6M3L6J3_9ZZZZ